MDHQRSPPSRRSAILVVALCAVAVATAWSDHEDSPGRVPAEIERFTEADLADASWVGGRVVDERGDAIPGAWATNLDPSNFRIRADAKGRFRFPRDFSFLLSAPGKATLLVDVHTFPSDVEWTEDWQDPWDGTEAFLGDIVLPDTVSGTVRVFDNRGKPVRKARIGVMSSVKAPGFVFETPTEPRIRVSPQYGGYYSADSAGRIELPNLIPGAEYGAVLVTRGYGLQMVKLVVPQDEVMQAEFTLEPEAYVQGRIVDSRTGAPEAGTRVYLEPQDRDNAWLNLMGYGYHTDTSEHGGKIHFGFLPAGTYMLRVEGGAQWPFDGPKVTLDAGDRIDVGDLESTKPDE